MIYPCFFEETNFKLDTQKIPTYKDKDRYRELYGG